MGAGQDRVVGKVKEVTGGVKEGVGRATGDPGRERLGRLPVDRHHGRLVTLDPQRHRRQMKSSLLLPPGP